jgi:hypothetical protein
MDIVNRGASAINLKPKIGHDDDDDDYNDDVNKFLSCETKKDFEKSFITKSLSLLR